MTGKNKSPVKKWFGHYGIYALAAVCFVLMCMVFTPVAGNNKENKDYVVRSSNDSLRQEDYEGNGNIFRKNENDSLTTLLRNYYGALMGREGLLLTRYVDDADKIPYTTRRFYSSYVKRINSMDVYVADGLLDNSYIVAVVGYQVIAGVENQVPFIDKLFIMTNSEGNLYIATKEQSESVAVYNELMYEADSIVKLSDRIAVEFDELLDDEPELRNIFATLGDN